MSDAIRANPGGIIDPRNVIGRDKLIGEIWRRLEQQSIILSAERRMGKTTIINKMQAEAGEKRLPIFHDLEGIKSAVEFVEAIWQDAVTYLSAKGKSTKKFQDFLRSFKGIEIKGFKIPEMAATQWKTLLTKIIEDLVENQDGQVIFLWDEVPYMLDNMSKNKPEEAMELLDVLRMLRQTYDIRMIFTGSIGLHHIVKKLQQQGYSNEPTNDMYPVEVTPLTENHAQNLAVKLLRGERIESDNPLEIASEIAKATNNIPFYIHHLVNDLRFTKNITPEVIEQTLETSFANPQNPWKMEHYRDRINNYYAEDQKPYALKILDLFAEEDSLTFKELWNRLSLNPKFDDEETARNILRLLLKDYYLQQKAKSYSFRYPIIKKYWELLRA